MQACKQIPLVMKNPSYKIRALYILLVLTCFVYSVSLHSAATTSISVTYAGTYSPSLTYAKGNVVKFGNCTYLALGTVAANASPVLVPSIWTVFGILPENNTFGGANNFSLDFVTIGNPGNSNDITGYGKVAYNYQMGTYAISQNQIDIAAMNGLQGMPTGDWTGDLPATSIRWDQIAAFINWLNTSQGYRPAYNLTYSNGYYNVSLWPTNQAWTNGGTNLYRNANCVYFLPNENEWYKAAYYDPNKNGGRGGYWLYPTGSSTAPNSVVSGTAQGSAVYGINYNLGPASVYQSGGLSPYGIMGMGGNVDHWLESAFIGSNTNPAAIRVVRGGDWTDNAGSLLSTSRINPYPIFSHNSFGFRVARILP